MIGEVTMDYAINVSIEELGSEFWFAPELLELVDHAEGTEIVIGNYRAVRRADGTWEESGTNTKKDGGSSGSKTHNQSRKADGC